MKYGYDVEVNATVISNYVNDNLDSLTKGEGLDGDWRRRQSDH